MNSFTNKMPDKTLGRMLGVLAGTVAAVAISASTAFAADPAVTLRIAHTGAQTEPYQVGFDKFKAEVEKASGGSIKAEIFPNGQLGDEGSVLKGIQNGSIAMATVANATISDFAPEMHLFDLPFLFKDRTQAYHVLDSQIGQGMAAPLSSKGFVLLGYYEAGVRHVINNQKPIATLADFKGMKVRVIPSGINIDTFKALGANPVPLPYSELYTALQTKVVDAAEVANSNYDAKKFYEVAPNYAMVAWQILIAPVVISKRVFDKMTPAQQKAVKDALKASLDTERQGYQSADDEALKALKTKGVKITEPDRGPWIEAVKPVWEKWAATVGQKNLDAIAVAH